MQTVKSGYRQEITRKDNVVQGGKLSLTETIENAPERVNRRMRRRFSALSFDTK